MPKYFFSTLLLFGFIIGSLNGSNNPDSPSSELLNFITGFKAVSMHFAEAFLKKVRIRGEKMESFHVSQIVPIATKAMIETFGSTYPNQILKKFATNLERDYSIQQDAVEIRHQKLESKIFNEEAERIEKRMFKPFGETVMSLSWSGPKAHGLLLIIKPSEGNYAFGSHYDISLFNTGMGLNYHELIADTQNEIYPSLARPWILYEKIPRTLFVGDDHWFVRALGLLGDSAFMANGVEKRGKSAQYLYESIFSNFKQYKVKESIQPNDDRYMRAQLSGSCAYTSILAGLLHESKNLAEFLKYRFLYGLQLLENFLALYENSNIIKDIFKDGYEPMLPYLMKHLISGLALQALEYVESADRSNFKSSALLGKGKVEILQTSSASSASSASSEINLEMQNALRKAVGLAFRIKKLIEGNPVDPKTATVSNIDVSKAKFEKLKEGSQFNDAKFALNQKDIEKLKVDERNWPGKNHPYIQGSSEYDNFLKDLENPKTKKTLQRFLVLSKKIREKSENMGLVDSIMGTYAFDFIRSFGTKIKDLIAKSKDKDTLLKILSNLRWIIQNFIEESREIMNMEDFAAMAEMTNIVWALAVRIDKISEESSQLGLDNYLAPHADFKEWIINRKIDHQGEGVLEREKCNIIMGPVGYNLPVAPGVEKAVISMDTCASTPAWLSTENEVDAWIMLEKARAEMNFQSNDNQKQRLFDPKFLVPEVNLSIFSESILNRLPKHFTDLLEKITKKEPAFVHEQQSRIYRNNPNTGKILALSAREEFVKHYPHFYDVLATFMIFYKGVWRRPSGTLYRGELLVDFTTGMLDRFFPLRGTRVSKRKPGGFDLTSDLSFKLNVAVNELIHFKNLSLKRKLDHRFYEERFCKMRGSEALQEPQSAARFYSFLANIENSNSCVLFEQSEMVYIADRTLGLRVNFDPKMEKNNSYNSKLIDRVIDSLVHSINSEISYLNRYFEVMSINRKERHVKRTLIASFVLVRFIDRLTFWKISCDKSAKFDEILANLHSKWFKYGKFSSDLELAEDLISKVNLFLYTIIKSVDKLDLNSVLLAKFLKNSGYNMNNSELAKDIAIDYSELIAAARTIHYFMAAAFTYRSAPSKDYNLLDKLAVILRSKPLMPKSKEALDLVLEHVGREMVARFDTINETDETLNGQYDRKDWKFILSDDIIEIKRSDSESNIPFIILRLSTAKIIFEGVPVVHRSRIYNSPVFIDFFSENDLAHARNGSIKPIGSHIGYSLPNFRGTGQNFLFLTNNAGDEIDVILNYNKERWLWVRPDSQEFKTITDPIRLINHRNVRVFKKVNKKLDKVQVIFVRETEFIPFLTLDIESYKVVSNSKFVARLPLIEDPVTLIDSSEHSKTLHKAFLEFSRPEFLSLWRKNDGKVVIMYGSYRLDGDNLPLIFEETADASDQKKSIFVLKNNSSWCLDENQFLGSDKNLFVMQRTIKIRNVSDPEIKSLLLANYKWSRNYSKEKEIDITAIIPVRMIKVSGGELIPSDRLQRLQLAYKMMVNVSTSMAQKLLHPIISIDQNSAFNAEESQVLNWITDLSIPNPEIYALKMMASAHILINSINYPKSFVKNTVISIKSYRSNFRVISIDYLFTAREITDKFYLHRSFPEVLEPFVFEALFQEPIKPLKIIEKSDFNPGNNSHLTILITKSENMMTEVFRCAVPSSDKKYPFALDAEERIKKKYTEFFYYNPYNLNYAQKLESSNFWDLLALLKAENMSSFTRLHYRSDDLPSNFSAPTSSFDFDLLLYCASQDSKIRDGLLEVVNNRSNYTLTDLHEKGSPHIRACFNNHLKNYITNYYVVPTVSSRVLTDIKKTKAIFEADLKSRQFSEDFEYLNGLKPFVDETMLYLFNAAVDTIKRISDDKSQHLKGSGDKKYLPVLLNPRLAYIKLKTSIQNFINSDSVDGGARLGFESNELNAIFDAIRNLNAELRIKLPTLNSDLETLATQLVELTLIDKEKKDFDDITVLKSFMNLKKSKTFSDLYACHYSSSEDCYRKKFPHITEIKTIKTIQEMTFKFYTITVLKDYLTFIQKKINEISSVTDSISLDDLANFVVELKKINHFDDRIRTPGILNLEYRSKTLRLREEQLADLKLLLTKQDVDGDAGEGKVVLFKSNVLQRMMAAGKTLVLGTLATIQKAREAKVLSILVPPSSLFQSNAASMQSRTYKFFKSRGIVLNFERLAIPKNVDSADRAINFLVWIQSNIKRLMDSRDYLLMSPDSLQSFLNSFIEFMDVYAKIKPETGLTSDKMIPKYEEILKNFATIYQIFRKQSSIILDEIDMTMNPKRELNYPTTNREKYNTDAVVLTTDLIEYAIFSTEMREKKLNILRNNQAGLTDSGYEAVVEVWLAYIEKALDDKHSLWRERLVHDRPHALFNKEWIMNFLRSKSPWDFILPINDEIRNDKTSADRLDALIIIRRQLDYYLREAFKNTVKEHFGPAGPLRPFIKYAVPYVAANTPSESSLFADRWETLNKSLLMMAVISLEQSEAVEFIRWLKERINIESKVAGFIELTATYKNFNRLIPSMNPLSIDHESVSDVARILAVLNYKSRAAIRLIFSFHLDTVISTLDFPTEQITSNALHMCSMFTSIQGYSGTIDNINILPSDVVVDAFKDNLLNEKNNGGIVKKLIDDSQKMPSDGSPAEYQVVPVAADFETIKWARKALQALLKAVPEEQMNNLSALIDVGAFLKNFKNAKVAESLLKIMKDRIRCVIYYDEKSNMLQYVVSTNLTSKDGDSSSSSSRKSAGIQFTHGQLTLSDPESIERTTGCKLHERFTYYDQRHITGSDILQPPTAWALLTFGSRNLLRDILQGALRMRQFMTSQKVQFVITKDVIDYYNSVIDDNSTASSKTQLLVSDVITLSALNEDSKQSRENVALTFTKLDVKLRESLVNEMAENFFDNQFIKAANLFTKTRPLFIRNFSEKPIAWIHQRHFVPAKESINSFKNSRRFVPEHILKQLDPLIEDCDEQIKGNEINQSVRCFTSKYLPLFDGIDEVPTEMQLELNTIQLNEFEVETVMDGVKFLDEPIKYKRFKLSDCQLLSDLSVELGVATGNMETKNVVRLDELVLETMQDPQVIQLLNDALFGMSSSSSDDAKIKSTFISRDLINIVNVTGGYPLDIFDFFNHDGTHFFVVIKDGKEFVMLVSNDIAHEMLNTNTNSYAISLWYLTDLKGVILKAKSYNVEKEDLIGKSILDKINKPAFHKQIFNLLVLNGSLLQLTAVPQMKALFFNDWLKSDTETKLTLLLTRMKALHRKDQIIFSSDDPLMTVIGKVLKGEETALNQLLNQSYERTNDEDNVDKSSVSSPKSGKDEFKRASGLYNKISVVDENGSTEDDGSPFSDTSSTTTTDDSISETSSRDGSDSETDDEDGSFGGGSGGGSVGRGGIEKKRVDLLDFNELLMMADDRSVTLDPTQVQNKLADDEEEKQEEKEEEKEKEKDEGKTDIESGSDTDDNTTTTTSNSTNSNNVLSIEAHSTLTASDSQVDTTVPPENPAIPIVIFLLTALGVAACAAGIYFGCIRPRFALKTATSDKDNHGNHGNHGSNGNNGTYPLGNDQQAYYYQNGYQQGTYYQNGYQQGSYYQDPSQSGGYQDPSQGGVYPPTYGS